MRNYKGIALLGLLFTSLCNAQSIYERITDFKSDIQINADSTIRVHETISAALPAGRHGLLREFPTYYIDKRNIKYNIDFNLESVTQNGLSVPFTIQSFANGKLVKIGDPYKTLSGGLYTFDIIYTTNRQIGFFENHDELYWNVTGNGWRLPIEHASARVTLPADVDTNKIAIEAYTGYQGEKGKNYKATIVDAQSAQWQTTRPLDRYEGLTIVMSWPKGLIPAPTFFTKLYYFFKDNLAILWLTLGLLILAAYCLRRFSQINKEQKLGTVIPLFYPPKDLTPGQVRYITKFGYDHKVFAADIINLAVHSYLTIDYQSSFFSKRYILRKTETGDPAIEKKYKPLLNILFTESKTLELSGPNNYSDYVHTYILMPAIVWLKNHLLAPLNKYFNYHENSFALAFIIAIITGIGYFFIDIHGEQYEYLFVVIAVMVFILVLFYYGIRGYCKDGLKLRNEIEGFKLFLSTAETERMKIVGTPPTRTPELYEKYLPYAVALDVEQQWSRQFAPIFAQLAAQGHAYIPMWYTGGSFSDFRADNFATNLSSSLQQSIASASTPPGSSSGSDGGGSSGGGGGGGGGGSW